MKKLLLLVCIFMAGCAPALVSVSDKIIIVKARRADLPQALDIAETECLKRGLHARAATKPAEDQFGFECIR